MPPKTTRLERHHGLSLTEDDVRAQLVEIEQKKAEKIAAQKEKRERAMENKAMRAKADAAAKKALKRSKAVKKLLSSNNTSSFPDAQPLMSQINDTLSSQQLIVSPAIRKCDKFSSCFGENPTMIWLACESCADLRCANRLPKSVKVTAKFFWGLE